MWTDVTNSLTFLAHRVLTLALWEDCFSKCTLSPLYLFTCELHTVMVWVCQIYNSHCHATMISWHNVSSQSLSYLQLHYSICHEVNIIKL